jgi:hypothetical protein
VDGGVEVCSPDRTLALPALTDGVHSAAAVAVDAAGNRGASVATVTWRRDTVPPVTTAVLAVPWVLLPFSDSVVRVVGSSVLAFNVSASEEMRDVVVAVNGGPVAFTLDARVGVVTTGVVPDGTVSVSVAAVDLAGNTDVSASQLAVLVDTTAPTTRLLVPPPSVTANGSVPLLVGVFNEAAGSLRGVLVAVLHAGNDSIAAGPVFVAAVSASLAVSVVVGPLAPGRYRITVAAEDVLGRVDAVGASALVTVDTVPPHSWFAVAPAAFTNASSVLLSVDTADDLSSVSVQVRRNGGEWQSTAAAALVSVVGLGEGVHDFDVRGVDGAGNVEPPPYISARVVVDTSVPVAWFPVAPDTYSAVASSVSFCSLDATPVVAFVAINGVSLAAPLSLNSSDTMPGCANISVAVDGPHVVSVSAVDAAGNTAPRQSLSYVLDRSPPTSMFVDPPSGLTTRSSVTLVVNASDALSPVVVSVRRDGGAWYDASMLDTLAASLTDGEHVFEVRAADAAGNVQPPPYVSASVVVDTVPPAVRFPEPPPRYSAVDTAVRVCAADAHSTTLFASVNGAAAVAVVLPPNDMMCTSVAVADDGPVTLSAWAVDAAGNTAAPVVVTYALDRQPPRSAFLVPLPPPYINVSSVDGVRVNVSDASPVDVAVRLDGGQWFNVSRLPQLASNLSDGAHTLHVRSTDAAGNEESAPFASVAVVVDTAPPQLFCAKLPPPHSQDVASVELCARDANEVNVSVAVNGAPLPVVHMPSSNCTSVATDADGPYVVGAACVDVAGNTAADLRIVFVRDRSPPTSTFVDPPSGYTANSSLTLVVNASDALSPVIVSVRRDGGAWVNASTLDTLAASLTDGEHMFEVRAVDAAGNVQPPPYASASVVVDTVPPVLALSSTSPLRHFVNTSDVSVCLVSNDASSVTVRGVVADWPFSWLASPGSVQRCVSPPPIFLALDGNFSLHVDGTDSAMLSAAALQSWLVVDTQPPLVTLALPSSGNASRCVTGRGSGAASAPLVVCSDAAALHTITAVCDSNATAASVPSPCAVHWRLETIAVSTSTLGCGTTTVTRTSTWSDVSVTAAVTGLAAETLLPRTPGDALYRVEAVGVDAAGNVGTAAVVEWWIDSLPPATPTFLDRPVGRVLAQAAVVKVACDGDASPGVLSLLYELEPAPGPPATRAASTGVLAVAATQNASTLAWRADISITGLEATTSYTLRVWSLDFSGLRSVAAEVASWTVVSSVPVIRVDARPSPVSGLRQVTFEFSAVYAGQVVNDSDIEVLLMEDPELGSWHQPCSEANAPADCASGRYTLTLPKPKLYTLLARVTLGGTASTEVATVTWEYKRCLKTEFAVFTGDAVACLTCPEGGDCEPRNDTHVVTQAGIVAQAGWWASSSSDGRAFYKCPNRDACLSPHAAADAAAGNVSRGACAVGYAGVLCSACARDFFPQYGKCAPCPTKASPVSWVVSISLPLVIVLLFGVMFVLRGMMPRGMMKVGLSMVQIIAAANSAYDIPWPPIFNSFLDVMKLFLVVRAVCCDTVECCAVLCAVCCAVLCCAVLCCAVLCCAVLCCAVLCCAVL